MRIPLIGSLLRGVGLTTRIPQVGDPVWWANKRDKCVVDRVEGDGIICFHSTDQLVRRPSGKVVPRWTGASAAENFRWDENTEIWVLGEGVMPRKGRTGQLEFPEPLVEKAEDAARWEREGVKVIRPRAINSGVGSAPGRAL